MERQDAVEQTRQEEDAFQGEPEAVLASHEAAEDLSSSHQAEDPSAFAHTEAAAVHQTAAAYRKAEEDLSPSEAAEASVLEAS